MEGPFQEFISQDFAGQNFGQDFAAPQTPTHQEAQDPTHFTRQMLDILGPDFDPDSLFLEESWTLGLPTAIANWRNRQHNQADREHRARAFQQFSGLHVVSAVSPEESAADLLASERTATIARHYGAEYADSPASPTHRTQKTAPVPQQGTSSEYREASPRPLAEPWEAVMTAPAARQILGVAATSSRGEIRSAYRALVKQWHPDRLQTTSEAARSRAGVRMAALNEAYHLLCA